MKIFAKEVEENLKKKLNLEYSNHLKENSLTDSRKVFVNWWNKRNEKIISKYPEAKMY